VNPALRSSAAHLFVDSLDAPLPTAEDAHHLFRVLRVRDGETVTVCDGAGGWRVTRVEGGELVCAGDIVREPDPQPCTIAVAIPKGDRLEWMVQKVTEVGATRVLLVDCARSVVRWDAAKAERQLERLRRIARDAAGQSRRTWLPAVDGPVPFAVAAAIPGAVMADPAGEPGDLGAVVLIGPEGGFAADELAIGLAVRSLGDTVLRVETAALVAVARMQAGKS
jgi:16S rRNA (uracil1498-N3)-methyltransferase